MKCDNKKKEICSRSIIVDRNKDVEKLIDDCIDLDIYVIVDWHILKDNNPNVIYKILTEKYDKNYTIHNRRV